MDESKAVSLPPEVDEFLQAHTRTFLLTLRADGSPTAHPMIGLYKDGRLYFNTYRKSAKARNVQRDPRTTCLVTTKHDDSNFKAVLFHGRGHILEGAELPQRPRPAGTGNVVPSGVSARSSARLESGKRIVIEVTPEQVEFLDKVWGG